MENTTTKSGADTNVNNQNVKGDLTYEDKVIQKIIGIALENIDGLLTPSRFGCSHLCLHHF
jgi:hypothetical protein